MDIESIMQPDEAQAVVHITHGSITHLYEVADSDRYVDDDHQPDEELAAPRPTKVLVGTCGYAPDAS